MIRAVGGGCRALSSRPRVIPLPNVVVTRTLPNISPLCHTRSYYIVAKMGSRTSAAAVNANRKKQFYIRRNRAVEMVNENINILNSLYGLLLVSHHHCVGVNYLSYSWF